MTVKKMAKPSVFISHTKLDKNFCDRFDNAVARVGMKAFRSEFETIESPAWKTIKQQMEASCAMVLLVGKRLVNAQTSSKKRHSWKYTQNWIAYEIGLASELGIDVWVICDNIMINFPVPYLNNYSLYGLSGQKVEFTRNILEKYVEGYRFPLGYDINRKVSCPYKDCRAQYNLHSVIQKGGIVTCPTCLGHMKFENGWLLDAQSQLSPETT